MKGNIQYKTHSFGDVAEKRKREVREKFELIDENEKANETKIEGMK